MIIHYHENSNCQEATWRNAGTDEGLKRCASSRGGYSWGVGAVSRSGDESMRIAHPNEHIRNWLTKCQTLLLKSTECLLSCLRIRAIRIHRKKRKDEPSDPPMYNLFKVKDIYLEEE